MQAKFLGILLLTSLITNSWSLTLVLPDEGDLVGEIQYSKPEIGESLEDVGLRFDIGYYEMVRANPKINPTQLLSPNTRVIIPSQFILPPGQREGLVINLAEYRLYYYPPDDEVVITMPVGIGRQGWATPLGLTKVVQKERNPIWRPTESVRAEAAKKGRPIPQIFPPGEGNPLGSHVLRLGWPTYLIHGSNRRDGIGSRVSAGCLRMMPEDIEYLYKLVKVGTKVRILNEPLKIGQQNGALYLEAHPPLSDQKSNLKAMAEIKLAALKVNSKLLKEELTYPTGMPKRIA